MTSMKYWNLISIVLLYTEQAVGIPYWEEAFPSILDTKNVDLPTDVNIGAEVVEISKDIPSICFPLINPNKKQYIIAYGLFMQEAYRVAINPAISPALPITVKGYSRFWGTRVATVAVGGTFLAIKEHRENWMNGVMFSLDNAEDIGKYENTTLEVDANGFCRQGVHQYSIYLQGGISSLDPEAEYWIYVTKPENIFPPDKTNRVAMSYVDIFLEGCLEIEQVYGLENFLRNCITSTNDWTPFWVNDRIYPSRPFSYSPHAAQFDALLGKLVPLPFSQIQLG